jgi:signal transduction histidine kinase
LGALLMLDGLLCRLGGTSDIAQELNKFVDTRIRVRGIFTPDVNSRSEAALLKILVADPKTDIDIVEPPPKDPFQAPRVPIGRLMPFSPDSRPWHRRVVSGVVTLAVPNRFFFLQDGATGLRVDSPCKVSAGQQVDVSGFVDTSHTFASLRNALVRVIGQSAVPAAVPVNVTQLMDPANRSDWGKPLATDFGGRWVKLSGVLRRVDRKSGKDPFAILVESDKKLFFARIPDSLLMTESQIAGWKPGATVEVKGVCEYEFPEKGEPVSNYTPTGFYLWLAGPEDVQVTKPAPWWTTNRLLAVLGGVLLTFGLVVVWNLSLQRQVQRQVGIISQKSNLAAAEGERVRIARDLHDDIGTELSSMAMLADLVKRDACADCSGNPRLGEISTHAHRTVRQLEEIVWAINPANDTVERFASYFCKRVQAYLTLAGVSARFDLPEIFPDYPLPGRLRHNLFLAAKEAVYNAVRHGTPTQIICRMAISGDTLTVSIEDNGCGFEENKDATVVQGSSNMRKRMEDIGGAFSRQSVIGKGTTVQFSISLKKGAA